MAGARPSGFKAGGGGFLNGVDGLLQDYEFTTDHPGGGKKKGKSDFTPLYFVPTILVDGADDAVTTSVYVGSADDFEIDDDGKTLVPVDEENGGLRQNSDFAILIDSMCKHGFPESSLPDDKINYEAILGYRMRFVQEVDKELTQKLGKKKSKDGKKEYDRTRLKVTEVYPQDAKASKGKATSKPKGKAAEADDDDDNELETIASQALIAVLKKNGKKISKKKLPVQIINQIGAKHPQRNEIKDLVTSDKFLTSSEDWTYDEDTEVVELA